MKIHLRYAAKKRNMTLKELAENINYSYSAVTRWSNGESTPSLTALETICEVLECNISEIIEFENVKSQQISIFY